MSPKTFVLLAFALGAGTPQGDAPHGGRWIQTIIAGSVDGTTARAPALVYLPQGYSPKDSRRLLIALHGWGHAPEDFRAHTRLAALAEEKGLVVVIPAMGKTVYESRFYPETRSGWGPIPGARWIGEVVLPFARARFGVSSARADTGILGYSTGGRGAVVVAERYPAFGFVASLSGTFALFDLAPRLGEYRIHAAVFGEREKWPERWKCNDAVRPDLVRALDDARVYLAHGARDAVVPPAQLAAMARALEAGRAAVAIELDAEAGHDWSFWDRALEKALVHGWP